VDFLSGAVASVDFAKDEGRVEVELEVESMK
jgi:hypothetical protein